VQRPLIAALAALTAAAVALPATALGIRVHVRVEGAKATIFGTAQPLLEPFTGELVAEDGTPVALTQPTALGALEAASARREFFYRLVAASFGPYVSQIGRLAAEGASGWVYKVNGVSPPVGADAYVLEEGDEVLWYHATFGKAGGPKTLDLVVASRGCFRAYEVDDAGARTPARDVVFRLRGRSISDGDGLICPRGHWHRLKATKPGLVRSETVVHY
jgi:hypothetical protein